MQDAKKSAEKLILPFVLLWLVNSPAWWGWLQQRFPPIVPLLFLVAAVSVAGWLFRQLGQAGKIGRYLWYGWLLLWLLSPAAISLLDIHPAPFAALSVVATAGLGLLLLIVDSVLFDRRLLFLWIVVAGPALFLVGWFLFHTLLLDRYFVSPVVESVQRSFHCHAFSRLREQGCVRSVFLGKYGFGRRNRHLLSVDPQSGRQEVIWQYGRSLQLEPIGRWPALLTARSLPLREVLSPRFLTITGISPDGGRIEVVQLAPEVGFDRMHLIPATKMWVNRRTGAPEELVSAYPVTRDHAAWREVVEGWEARLAQDVAVGEATWRVESADFSHTAVLFHGGRVSGWQDAPRPDTPLSLLPGTVVVPDGPPVWSFDLGHNQGNCLALSADGRWLSARNGEEDTVFSLPQGQPVLTLPAEPEVACLAFRPGSDLVARHDGETVTFLALPDGARVAQINLNRPSRGAGLIFSQDGRWLLTFQADIYEDDCSEGMCAGLLFDMER
jgi:hypothetical protein